MSEPPHPCALPTLPLTSDSLEAWEADLAEKTPPDNTRKFVSFARDLDATARKLDIGLRVTYLDRATPCVWFLFHVPDGTYVQCRMSPFQTDIDEFKGCCACRACLCTTPKSGFGTYFIRHDTNIATRWSRKCSITSIVTHLYWVCEDARLALAWRCRHEEATHTALTPAPE